jgi:16S rRNA (guanine(966)-N(2))-methyltransferase RsmD
VRIIAGEFRGRRIGTPPGRTTRPMLDRVREALFSTLQRWTPDAVVLDLFAGSGSLGLEALSRGARRVRFVERGGPALTQLRKNVGLLGVHDRVEISDGDALRASTWGTTADVVFLDPPYALLETSRSRLLGTVERLVTGILTPGGVLVLHTPRGALAAPEVTTGTARVRRYGSNDLWYVERE